MRPAAAVSAPPRTPLDRALAHLENQTLQSIPSRLAQLVYLATTRNVNTGRFEHFGLATEFGDETAHTALEQCRDRTYQQLALLPVSGMKEELVAYCQASAQDCRAVCAAWTDIPVHHLLAPQNCDPLVSRLFQINLRAAIELLRDDLAAQPLILERKEHES
jgi:hypothetical protein